MLARLGQYWMRSAWLGLCAMAVASAVVSIAPRAQPSATSGPTYAADGRLDFPKDYRTWVYLSSGLDMSYLANATSGMSTFGNVFVNPQAYEAFLKSGSWPDKTVLVLEVRRAEQSGSIIKGGHFQSDIVHTEAHVKDAARFGGGWGFFGFNDETPAAMIPRSATCYSCHQDNGAVDTTFVQFYPTLLAIARAKKTLSPSYTTPP
jgi:hypothetical protein